MLRALSSSAFVMTILFAGSLRAAPIFDAAADFSLAANPNGAWSYGYSSTPGGGFTPFASTSTSFLNPNFQTWLVVPALHPFISKNVAGTQQQGAGLNLLPGKIGLHPGPDPLALQAVLRWTAPSSGLFDVNAVFEGRDPDGQKATTDVYIFKNGSLLTSGAINNAFGPGSGPSYSAVLAFSSGDVLDFVVGNGGNNFFSDSTGLDATITQLTAVPEPTSLALWVLGSTGLIGFRSLRRRRS